MHSLMRNCSATYEDGAFRGVLDLREVLQCRTHGQPTDLQDRTYEYPYFSSVVDDASDSCMACKRITAKVCAAKAGLSGDERYKCLSVSMESFCPTSVIANGAPCVRHASSIGCTGGRLAVSFQGLGSIGADMKSERCAVKWTASTMCMLNVMDDGEGFVGIVELH